jgi:hypothetical protein
MRAAASLIVQPTAVSLRHACTAGSTHCTQFKLLSLLSSCVSYIGGALAYAHNCRFLAWSAVVCLPKLANDSTLNMLAYLATVAPALLVLGQVAAGRCAECHSDGQLVACCYPISEM